MSARPSARAPLIANALNRPAPERDELGILHAKARVCDAYRCWLVSPHRPERAVVCEALAELSRIEGHDA